MPDDERYDDPTDQPDEGMGISSERVGPTGHGRHGTTGVRDTSMTPAPDDAAAEQSTGGPEDNPDGLAPRADPPSLDPRSADDS